MEHTEAGMSLPLTSQTNLTSKAAEAPILLLIRMGLAANQIPILLQDITTAPTRVMLREHLTWQIHPPNKLVGALKLHPVSAKPTGAQQILLHIPLALTIPLKPMLRSHINKPLALIRATNILRKCQTECHHMT